MGVPPFCHFNLGGFCWLKRIAVDREACFDQYWLVLSKVIGNDAIASSSS